MITIVCAIAVTIATTQVSSLRAAPAPTPALDDATIVAIFDAANTWDIETGALAEKQGTTKKIRDFGAMLVHDHTMVRQQGRDLAKKLGVQPTPPKDFALAKDHEVAMKTLRAAKGADFDRAFLQHEVAYHKAVIDAVTSSPPSRDEGSGPQGPRDEGRTGISGTHDGRASEARRVKELIGVEREAKENGPAEFPAGPSRPTRHAPRSYGT